MAKEILTQADDSPGQASLGLFTHSATLKSVSRSRHKPQMEPTKAEHLITDGQQQVGRNTNSACYEHKNGDETIEGI